MTGARGPLRGVSLFSGAGGMDCGFEAAGFETVFANEMDASAAATWRANRPGAESAMREGDIACYMDELPALAGTVDVLYGGPPCQGFSVAGKMDPKDPRSGLVMTFMDAVESVRPRVFVMENVDALGRMGKWAGVREAILGRAAGLGYDVDYRIWNTWEFGVPQKRRRVIFVGVRDGDASLFAGEMDRHRREAPSAREAILSAGPYGTDENPKTCTSKVTLLKKPVMRPSVYAGMVVNGWGRPVDLEGLVPALPATMGGNKTPIVDQAALEDPGRENWFVGYHRGLVEGTASPFTTELPDHLRRLTVKEAAAVQTFPAGYVFEGCKMARYHQIGNAVPSLFAEAVARSVRACYFDRP